jgi:hypothetical protein
MKELYKIILDYLQIPPEFLRENQDKAYEILMEAADQLKREEVEKTEKYGLNRLIFLGNSIVFLGSKEDLRGIVSKLKSKGLFPKIQSDRDLETIITIACLYNLLTDSAITERCKQKGTEETLKYIRKSLDNENWFLTPDTTKLLGIEQLAA